jgi:hypothetical protein
MGSDDLWVARKRSSIAKEKWQGNNMNMYPEPPRAQRQTRGWSRLGFSLSLSCLRQSVRPTKSLLRRKGNRKTGSAVDSLPIKVASRMSDSGTSKLKRKPIKGIEAIAADGTRDVVMLVQPSRMQSTS